MLTGDNGILQQAGEAREQTEKSQEKQQISLAYSNLYMSQYTSTNLINAENLLEQLKKENIKASTVYGQKSFAIIMENNEVYELNENGNVEYMGVNTGSLDVTPIIKGRLMSENEDDDSLLFWKKSYRENIKKIEFKPYILEMSNYKEKWDVSLTGNNSVIAYLMEMNMNYILWQME